MHRSGLAGMIIDCNTDDLGREAKFWSGALGLAILPLDHSEPDRYIGLQTSPGEPYIELQAVDHPSRVHLDIKTDDLEAEVARLKALGAKPLERIKHWQVMQAPSGHRFCVVQITSGKYPDSLNVWQTQRG